MTSSGIFCENNFGKTAFMAKKSQLILVTYAVNIVPDLCEKWKRTLEK